MQKRYACQTHTQRRAARGRTNTHIISFYLLDALISLEKNKSHSLLLALLFFFPIKKRPSHGRLPHATVTHVRRTLFRLHLYYIVCGAYVISGNPSSICLPNWRLNVMILWRERSEPYPVKVVNVFPGYALINKQAEMKYRT